MTKRTLYHVLAVIDGKPLAKQNSKPLEKQKALALVEKLQRGAVEYRFTGHRYKRTHTPPAKRLGRVLVVEAN